MVSKPKNRQLGGRPQMRPADRRGTIVRVLTTKAEHAELKEAAAEASMSVSTWLRSVGLERARAVAAEKEAARNRDKK